MYLYLWIDKKNKVIVVINNTKSSNELLSIKKNDDTFVHLFSIYSRISRNNISINYEQFDIPEKNRMLFTAKEYLEQNFS